MSEGEHVRFRPRQGLPLPRRVHPLTAPDANTTAPPPYSPQLKGGIENLDHCVERMPFGAPTHHDGRTEGVDTRTERGMRQMHGRAGFRLLRHRILLP
ncbi:hypothetical protein OG948_33465 [Embleya sp. NBC_00888]|uniref:hypothetical protein n=1 Tax=Embleya sp. NBC_00888 TaxID=2975960 RepID=UPI00386C9FCC|nr:hypothetical protein OG948_33465 [Embleya sp. NBC_00888]